MPVLAVNTQKKEPKRFLSAFVRYVVLDSARNFTRTQAAGADVNPFWGTVYDSFYTSYIRFPCPVGTPVRVGNFYTKSNILAANFTFCHMAAPPL